MVSTDLSADVGSKIDESDPSIPGALEVGMQVGFYAAGKARKGYVMSFTLTTLPTAAHLRVYCTAIPGVNMTMGVRKLGTTPRTTARWSEVYGNDNVKVDSPMPRAKQSLGSGALTNASLNAWVDISLPQLIGVPIGTKIDILLEVDESQIFGASDSIYTFESPYSLAGHTPILRITS